MPVKSLRDLAMSACIRNVGELDSVGDYLLFENLRPILLQVDNAHQLRQIELNSPQIDGETGEIWLRLIERDFPLEYRRKAYKPQNPKKWYRVWEKYKKDHDRAVRESEANLMNALAGIQEDREKNTSKIIERDVERRYLPRIGRAVPKRNTLPRRDKNGNTLTFGGGSRTKTSTGASVMKRVRREAKEIASIHGALSRPTRPSSSGTQIKRAPVSMLQDHRRATQPTYRSTPKALEPPSFVTEHERRATFISDTEDEDDEQDDEPDSDFDSPAPRKATTKSIRTPTSRSSTSSSPSKQQARPTSLPPAKPSSGSRSVGAIRQTASETSGSNTAPLNPKRSSGILSNRFKPRAVVKSVETAVSKSPPKVSPRPPPMEERRESSQYLPRTQTSPPLVPIAGPSSPPPGYPMLGTSTEAQPPRKRKAVDIFMRPKKKV